MKQGTDADRHLLGAGRLFFQTHAAKGRDQGRRQSGADAPSANPKRHPLMRRGCGSAAPVPKGRTNGGNRIAKHAPRTHHGCEEKAPGGVTNCIARVIQFQQKLIPRRPRKVANRKELIVVQNRAGTDQLKVGTRIGCRGRLQQKLKKFNKIPARNALRVDLRTRS